MTTIRNVKPTDLDRVAEIESICFPPAEAAEYQSIRERIAAFPESFFVAEEGGQIIGFINGCVTDSETIYDDLFHSTEHHKPNGASQAIFGLDVVPEYQRKGIAAQLINHMTSAAKSAGRKRVILTCKEHLVWYYEKFGFVNMGKSQSSHGGAVWYDMKLEF